MYARWYNGGLWIVPKVDEDHDTLMGVMNLLKSTRLDDGVVVRPVAIIETGNEKPVVLSLSIITEKIL